MTNKLLEQLHLVEKIPILKLPQKSVNFKTVFFFGLNEVVMLSAQQHLTYFCSELLSGTNFFYLSICNFKLKDQKC